MYAKQRLQDRVALIEYQKPHSNISYLWLLRRQSVIEEEFGCNLEIDKILSNTVHHTMYN